MIAVAYRPYLMQHSLPVFQDWLTTHFAEGLAIYVAAFAISTALLIPATFPILLAGLIFKPALGIAIVMLGTQLSIMLSFCLSWLVNMPIPDYLSDMQRDMAARPFSTVVLFRLVPLPLGFSSYVLILSTIPLHLILLGSMVGTFPGILLYAFLGSLLGSELPLRARLIIGILTTSVGIVCMNALGIMASRSLRVNYQVIESSTPPEEAAASDDEIESVPAEMPNFKSEENALMIRVTIAATLLLVIGLPIVMLTVD